MVEPLRPIRALAALLAMTVILSLTLSAPANAASVRWNDGRCDVFGYDWYADQKFNGKCAGIDMYWVEAVNSANAVSVTVKYDLDLPWYLKENEKQRVWFNTDRDGAPEYMVAAYRPNYKGTVGRLARVNGWSDFGREIACSGDSIKILPLPELLTVQIPRSCLSRFGAVRVSVRSSDRFDSGKSWRLDAFPALQSWSPPVARS